MSTVWRRIPQHWTVAVIVAAVILALVGLGSLLPGLGGRAPVSAIEARSADPTPERSSEPTATPSPTPVALPPLRFRATTVTLATEGFFSWALMDRRTGEIWGSSTIAGTTWPASMIKPWLVADYLRRASTAGQVPSGARLHELEIAIRDSDNNAAQDIYVRNGGNASILRLIKLCRLTDTKANPKGWSFTNISARDTVRMADCIANGTAAGPRWTPWVMEMMRTVRIGGWGIRSALPAAEAAQVSIKNGWLYYTDDHNWHINCMAVTDTWAMAVLQRYKGHGMWNKDFAYGQEICRRVALQLENPLYPGTG